MRRTASFDHRSMSEWGMRCYGLYAYSSCVYMHDSVCEHHKQPEHRTRQSLSVVTSLNSYDALRIGIQVSSDASSQTRANDDYEFAW